MEGRKEPPDTLSDRGPIDRPAVLLEPRRSGSGAVPVGSWHERANTPGLAFAQTP
jgi:hypothetical protein